jgi:hypothetical protein
VIQTEHKLYEADRKPGPIVEAACWGFKGSSINDDVRRRASQCQVIGPIDER